MNMTSAHSDEDHAENRKEHREHVLKDVESILLFIKNRLESNTSVTNIKAMLRKAGFDNEVIETAMKEVHRIYSDTQQDMAASNSFLPLLVSKRHPGGESYAPVSEIRKGDIFSGRINRANFILGFLFLFSIGILVLLFLLTALQIAYPAVFSFLLQLSAEQVDGLGLFIVPVALAPVTVLTLSIIGRRLHDLGMSDIFAVGFLSFFLVPVGEEVLANTILALQAIWVVLFIILLMKPGDKGPNKYGPRRTRKGTLFSRLFAY